MAAKTITEAELHNFLMDQELLQKTEANARQLSTLVSAREKDLMERIQAGAKIEGRLTAAIDLTQKRRTTPWKQVARDLWAQLKLDPDLMEAKTKELTEATVYPHLVVQPKDGKGA